LRDELKFAKFIGRLRKRFSEMFQDMLKTQLILKGVISPEDWDDMKEHIQYDFLFDNHFNQLKEIEMMNQRITAVTQMDPFVGKYFSVEYVRRRILGQSDKEYIEIDRQMNSEIKSGLAIDPTQTNMMDTMQQQNTAFGPEIQNIQAQDAASREAQSADANLDREIKKMKAQPKPSPKSK
ncbi:MAG: portal protein, partial [Candidatus Nanopelagicaceae bacterium]